MSGWCARSPRPVQVAGIQVSLRTARKTATEVPRRLCSSAWVSGLGLIRHTYVGRVGEAQRRGCMVMRVVREEPGGDSSNDGRAKWRKKYKSVLPFAEVKRMAQGMGLRSKDDWDEWVSEGKKSPWFGPYMPSDPDVVYADEWESWDAFLGVMLPYDKARKISRALGLKSQAEWWAYASGGGAGGIKAAANKAAAEGKGAAAVYRAAQLAAERLRSLESERKHPNLPAIPHEFYKDDWRGYDDWLGLDQVLTVPAEWSENSGGTDV